MTVQQLQERPSLLRLYARAAITSRGRQGDRLPETTYEFTEISIDRDRLAAYNDVCGFRQSDVLPPTYPHILGFPGAVVLMVEPAFPFALPGLVHVNNRIEQKRDLKADETLSVTVRAANLRDHPRGRQFDVLTEVTVAGEPVWKEVSTYLHRERRKTASDPSPHRPEGSGDSPSPHGTEGPRDSPSPHGTEGPRDSPSPHWGEGRGGGSPATAIWRVPANVGRRYAAVSGDVNPIHMNPLVARLFGFPRAIAHGMWVKARCLAVLEGRLPPALVAEVEFKSPLLLPSTVGFRAQQEAGWWSVNVAQFRGSRTHLIGRIGGARP